MSSSPSPWLQMVHRLERAVGVPVEAAVRSGTYFDMVAQATRAQTRTADTLERLSGEWLTLFNMPAGSDVRRLREQLASMDRKLTRITKELEDLRGEPGRRP
jgi:Ser/Thr protein kinase RdoA (MazF antagonist)